MEERKEIALIDLFSALKRFWYIVIIVALLFTTAAYFFTKKQTPMYSQRLEFYVTHRDVTTSGSDISIIGNNIPFIADSVGKEKVVNYMYREYLSKKNYTMTTGALMSCISTGVVSHDDGSRQFYIEATAENPTLCKDILESYKEMFDYHSTIADPLPPDEALHAFNGFDVKTNDNAKIGTQVSPSMPKNLVIGFLIGAVVSYILVFIRYITDNVVNTAEDLSRRFSDIPILAIIPDIESDDKHSDEYVKSASGAKKKAVKEDVSNG